MSQHVENAKQGHVYRLDTREVMALENGYVVRVRELLRNEPYPLGRELTVKASWLVPLPMRYHGGEVP